MAHDKRVLDAVDAGISWREIVRASGLSTSSAMRARERLLASKRVTIVCDAKGSLGARYSVCSLLPPLLTPKS